MKMMILGNGNVGTNLKIELKNLGHDIIVGGRSRSYDFELNLDNISSSINQYKPEAIINAIGFKNVKECENRRIDALNSNVVAVQKILDGILHATHKTSYFYHLSTDYVFSGIRSAVASPTPWKATDIPDPRTYYGLTKFMAEQIMTNDNRPFSCNRYVIRTGGLFGSVGPMSFLAAVCNGVIKTHKEDKSTIDVYTNIVNSPTSYTHLAKSLIEIATNNQCNAIIHIIGKEPLSRARFAEIICDAFDLDPIWLSKVRCSPSYIPEYLAMSGKTYMDNQSTYDRLRVLKKYYVNEYVNDYDNQTKAQH